VLYSCSQFALIIYCVCPYHLSLAVAVADAVPAFHWSPVQACVRIARIVTSEPKRRGKCCLCEVVSHEPSWQMLVAESKRNLEEKRVSPAPGPDSELSAERQLSHAPTMNATATESQ